ncbi:hypothetical protein ACEZCY_26420 [Streptacidiphilus sp. N1-12]|uniref:Secreted protein n=2 Tax=Streptacidiphilus alkalitolerans TaxID=3342712 RepID=A0ABV6VFP1_9ACTN
MRIQLPHRKAVAGVTALLAAFAAGLLGAAPAHAAAAFSSIDASQFQLDPGTSFSTDKAAIAAVEATGAVTVQNANQVLTTGGHTGSVGLCHGTGLAASLSPSGFCWDQADDVSDSYTTAGGWTPQGITGSYDAQPNGLWSDGSGSHTAFIASWHFDEKMGTANAVANEFARITLVNADNNKINYNHLLLVQPTVDASGHADFHATPATHADGVVWYGNTVFVANGRWLQVYSLQHIWKMNSLQATVGITGSSSSARYSNYALPLVGLYRTTASDTTGCNSTTGTGVCLNSLSLDRSGADGLVSAEFYNNPTAGGSSAGGRVIRWPLNYLTALPSTDTPDVQGAGITHAGEAFVSPIWHMQGAATDGTNWYIAGDCPSGVGGGSNDTGGQPYSCIHKALPNTAPHVLTTSPVYTENLGYSPSSGRLWGINERINSTTGIRVVFSINT